MEQSGSSPSDTSTGSSAESTERESILDVLRLDGRFEVLLTALEATGLDEAVASGVLTLFAPTDDAFQPLIDAGVIGEPGLGTLTDILLYHAVDGRQSAFRLLLNRSPTTLLGTEVDASYRKRTLFINQARVISRNGHAPKGRRRQPSCRQRNRTCH